MIQWLIGSYSTDKKMDSMSSSNIEFIPLKPNNNLIEKEIPIIEKVLVMKDIFNLPENKGKVLTCNWAENKWEFSKHSGLTITNNKLPTPIVSIGRYFAVEDGVFTCLMSNGHIFGLEYDYKRKLYLLVCCSIKSKIKIDDFEWI